MTKPSQALQHNLTKPVSILPLAAVRIIFGVMMTFSMLRFWHNGWIDSIYVQPPFHFTYPYFDWVCVLPAPGMSILFALLILLSLMIAVGLFYRFSIVLFFLCFTYIELIDQATYLNHYYFISLFSFLMIWLPLHRAYSLDVRLGIVQARHYVPCWMVWVLRFQLGIVYFFAGLAKLNPDWMLQGLPMSIWLKAHYGFPIIGHWFDYRWVALLMSWAGALYDLTIPFWLSWRRSRPLAYLAVIVFHVLTGLLFPIGMFPWIMIAMTTVFFSAQAYEQVLPLSTMAPHTPARRDQQSDWRVLLLALFFGIQIILPLRHYAIPNDTNWTMQGYRFAWRVMLNEKSGYVTFMLTDPTNDQRTITYGTNILTDQQLRHMAYQPDMIWLFANYLDQQTPDDMIVTAEAYVTHNGRPSRLLLDPTIDLSAIPRHAIWEYIAD